MKNKLLAIPFCLLMACTHTPKTAQKSVAAKPKAVKKVAERPEKPIIHYSEKQLISFLDSVTQLRPQALAQKVSFGADSVFKSLTVPLNRKISPADFARLKRAVHKGMIDVHTAKSIFGKLKVDTNCTTKSLFDSVKKGNIYLQYYPFNGDKNKFDEFAVQLGKARYCTGAELYFFKGDKIIAEQDGYAYFDDDLNHFKNTDGKAIFYLIYEFDNGSGIWWNSYFFYKYDGYKLIPVLNIPRNINLLQPSPWGSRELWIESKVVKTKPLTIKMTYHQQMPDTAVFDHYTTDPITGPMLVNDSTLVRFTWNEHANCLEGQYQNSKISQNQILTYYLTDNELLFINVYSKKLKAFLLNRKKKTYILNYLNSVKNYSLR